MFIENIKKLISSLELEILGPPYKKRGFDKNFFKVSEVLGHSINNWNFEIIFWGYILERLNINNIKQKKSFLFILDRMTPLTLAYMDTVERVNSNSLFVEMHHVFRE